MNLKTLFIVTGVLLVLALGGWLFTGHEGAPEPTGRQGTPLLTAEQVQNAHKIRIESEDDTVTLRLAEDGWVVEEQRDFPADGKLIRRKLIDMTSRRFERLLTEDKETFADLGVLMVSENGKSPGRKKQTGTLLTFLDEKEQPLYRIVFGNARDAQEENVAGRGGMYVRLPDDDAAYLISDKVEIPTKSQKWLQVSVLDLDYEKELKAFRIKRGGKTLSLHRPDADTDWEHWSWDGESQAPYARGVKEVARGLSDLFIDRIADPDASAAALGRTKTATVEVDLFDGRSYTISVGEEADKAGNKHVTVHASLDPSITDDALKQRVADFNRKFDGRMLAVLDWAAERIAPPRKNFLDQG